MFNKENWEKVKDVAQKIGKGILLWSWVKGVLYWIIMSAGMIAEGAFLLASLWMSLNSSIHNFMRIFLTEEQTVHISELATAAYVGLPECILFLALVVVIGHVRTWLYGPKKDWIAFVWAILYGIPTLVFLILSVFTLGSSVLNVHFEMPPFFVVTRAIAGYLFGVIAFLYWNLGKPQEADRLKKKDDLIDQLRGEKDALASRIGIINANTSQREQSLNAEIEQLKTVLAESKNQQEALQNEVKKSNEMALEAYGEECINWLNSEIKTALIEEIMRFTGHSKRKIANALSDGKLQSSPRNKDRILISSLKEWLANTPPPERILHVVNE